MTLSIMVTLPASFISILIGLQGILNLPYLPQQLTDFVQSIASASGLTIPQVSEIFLASGMFWLPLGITIGIVIGKGMD